jgi:tetratricopeptide (TPR) repeat protein
VSDSTPSFEQAIERFVALVRSGSPTTARSFAAAHSELGPELLEALESVEVLERARAPQDPARDERVGPFRITHEIGRGGMGVVLEAIEEPLGRRVALKLLPLELSASPSAHARFQREAALAAKLDHPGICTVYGAGVSEGRPWIAMKRLEGETLARRITLARERGARDLELPGTRQGPPAIAECIARVARALSYAHEQGVLHRDVKPSNVMVTSKGEPVLLDFGLAIAAEHDATSLTRTGETAGTPAYLAPELLNGESARPDAACDVYALGVTLYECLALEAPFRGPTREALYRAILAAAPPDLRSKRRDVSRDLALVVATAIERDRSRRYRTAADLAADLEAVVAHRPIAARPIGVAGRALRWTRREPKQAALAGGLIAALIAASVIGGFLLASRKDVHAGRVAQRQHEIETAIVDGFSALTADQFQRADAVLAPLLALEPPPPEALVGRVLALRSLGRAHEASALLAHTPASPAYDGLRALVAGTTPPPEDPAWLARASSLDLFVDGERLREEAERKPHTQQIEWRRRALARFEQAIVRAPQARALYHVLRAQTAQDLGDPDAARSAAEALLSLWPDSAREVLAAGTAALVYDKETARILLERAVALDPSSAQAFHVLGVARHELGDDDGARAAWEHAIELGPTNAFTHNALATLLTTEGCLDDARDMYLQALSIDPRSISAWTYLGMLEWNTERYESAAQAFEYSVALDPNVPVVRGQYGLALLLTGKTDEAREQCEIAATQTTHPGVWCGYLEALLAQNDVRSARQAVDAALQWNPGYPLLTQLEERITAAEPVEDN